MTSVNPHLPDNLVILWSHDVSWGHINSGEYSLVAGSIVLLSAPHKGTCFERACRASSFLCATFPERAFTGNKIHPFGCISLVQSVRVL
ncbi:uncharacterized protein EI90DRAFT_3057436 [Cantharellus anzutake]|uniref:uncharacterized protein n=1 Tax=Cantharellus anzutake TaxID=1750568 RepID=UPI0019085D1E|nr:uncharacterized protein EI90DRAFT_3057436 [Cantharellus anzutake]KAF8331295.1 hypothetical protein EI90DRAFT_3057436 [Cantharellus anzutake]